MPVPDPDPAQVLFFQGASDFGAWLDENAGRAAEAWIGFYRADHPRRGLTWEEAVVEALCHGWIDGIRKKLDDTSYANRFTPRRTRSTWSNRNIDTVNRLIAEGRMRPAGLAAFEARKDSNSGIYSFEQDGVGLPVDYIERFQANEVAWAFFERQPPSYKRISTHWVMSAKREETRLRRLETLVADSESGLRIALVRR